jgi:hypothetical protein
MQMGVIGQALDGRENCLTATTWELNETIKHTPTTTTAATDAPANNADIRKFFQHEVSADKDLLEDIGELRQDDDKLADNIDVVKPVKESGKTRVLQCINTHTHTRKCARAHTQTHTHTHTQTHKSVITLRYQVQILCTCKQFQAYRPKMCLALMHACVQNNGSTSS